MELPAKYIIRSTDEDMSSKLPTLIGKGMQEYQKAVQEEREKKKKKKRKKKQQPTTKTKTQAKKEKQTKKKNRQKKKVTQENSL